MKNAMLAAVMHEKRKITIEEVELHEPKSDELLIKTEYVGICGSDVHFYKDGRLGNWVADVPLILGHESGGTVVAVGSEVKDFAIGDRVAMEPGVACGKCIFCKTGHYNLCENMSFMAIPHERNGAFSEYIVHPANMCFKLPDNVSTLAGALIEPLAVGFHAVNQSGGKIGQNAVILGAGCIGLVTLMVLKSIGINEIYVVDLITKRLEKAAELGATACIKADEADIVEYINKVTNGHGCDLVFETAGSKITTLLTSKLVSKGGTVTLVGMAADAELTYDIGSLTAKEAKLETVFRYRNLYPIAIKAVSESGIPIESIVSHTFDFSDISEGIEYNINHASDVIKAVIKF